MAKEWRGPEYPGDFPSLGYVVADWIEANCAIPDGEQAGEPFILTDEQLRFVVWHYRLKPRAKAADKPSASFIFRRSQLVRPQKWGKGPLSAGVICAEAAGPVIFDGWDGDGEPVGRPWATPWIQVVAVSEDQTDNVWTALVPMIELGELKAEIPDTGKTRINVAGAYGSNGLIEPVTSAAVSRLGQRITFAVHDETHSWLATNQGVRLADVQRRNLGGMGGRSIETTNAWDPTDESVAQVTYESGLADVYCDYPEPLKGSFRNKRERRRVLRHAYAGAPWVDLDRIEGEIEELAGRDINQAIRFYGNRIEAGADKAFDLEAWQALADPDHEVPEGAKITLGFDGSRRQDSTGLVATEIATGYQFVLGAWERPRTLSEDEWEVPEDEVDEAVTFAFEHFDVWRMYADPPYWETPIDEWAGRYGEERVVKWWTNRSKAMAYALRAWIGDWRPTVLSHDGHEILERHIANAVKKKTRIRDEDTGDWLWLIRKDGTKSPRKIDLAMAADLSWEGKGDAVRAGVLDEPNYERASWGR